ncbi:SDR family oxidoreductase [[Mycoplasma] testudinis]|uniref:SDR family oxidoreductase n=1 Tax=[Mycoplasma] testudinis TaxID=33924 RepID=UPI000483B897|nr:SDR family oxidoreductase [[Mycoplasma] testudinis]
MNLKFQNKVVVLTGAGGVIVSSLAKNFAKQGAKVALLDLNLAAAQKAADAINTSYSNQAFAYACNVLEKEQVEKVHEQILKDLGKCDILINGAGGNSARANTDLEFHDSKAATGVKTFFDLDKAGFQFVFDLNIMGTLIPTQVFAKDMVDREGSNIINISSMNAFTPLTKIPAYSSAKAGVSNLTQWLAVHFSKVKIRVNAIAPGFLVTAQNKDLLFNKDGTPTERSKKILRNTPMDRYGDPEEMFGAVQFLASQEDASFITGVILPIDGGFSAYSGV